MPTVATLANNIVVKVNGREHMPAHIHVESGREEVLLVIVDGSIYSGAMNATDLATARAYLAANRLALCNLFFANNHKYARIAADTTAKCAAAQAAYDAANQNPEDE